MIKSAIYKATFALALLSGSPAVADDIEDAYKKGVEAGWAAGYQQGLRDAPTMMAGGGSSSGGFVAGGWGGGGTTTTFSQQPGSPTFVLPGTNFNTTIDATGPAPPLNIPSDSSVAIIPKKSLTEIQQKLGVDFLKDSMILNRAPGT
jgi:hypothetical protein